MRIGIAQINPTLGDFVGNRREILDFIHQAQNAECDLVVFPELSLMGYLPNDLLERSSVIDEQLKEFQKLCREIPAGISALVGLVTKSGRKKGKPYFNSAALITRGKAPKFFHKELLPTYDVFDEARHLAQGSIGDGFFTFQGRKFLLTICEDIWGWEIPGHPTNYLENPLVALKKNKVELVINMSASPFTHEKAADRATVVARTAKNFSAPMVYVNMVGGQDEVIFDGGSFAVDKRGRVIAQCPHFEEGLLTLDLDHPVKPIKMPKASRLDRTDATRRALVLGMRDYGRKTGIAKAHLGLSGGIDSAVVACLAVEAFGSDNVKLFTLPGPFSAKESRTLADELAKNLEVECRNLDIRAGYEAVLRSLEAVFGKMDFGVMHENLQARLRGIFMMAVANRENSMLLTTGNKSEYATGYSTLYGDMCGGLAPIADLVKGEVYDLAKLYNSQREIIPARIIKRPPTAELRPNQKDQDSLPPYDELDRAVINIVEKQKPARGKVETWLLEALMKSEFKRWQAPPVLKVSGHAFGRGRRMPIAHRARF